MGAAWISLWLVLTLLVSASCWISPGDIKSRGKCRAIRMTETTEHRPNVVVLGGGFGGLYSALRLSTLAQPSPGVKPPFDITLVDRSDRFVFLPLLYELAVGDCQMEEVAPTFQSLLSSSSIKFVQAAINEVNPQDQWIRLSPLNQSIAKPQSADHLLSEISYDRLVVALGSEPKLSSIPGAQEHAMTFHSLQDAETLSRRLAEIDAAAGSTVHRIIIIGAGFSGVELATNLAGRLGRDRSRITLVDQGDRILQRSPDENRAAANKRLIHEGVETVLGVDVQKVAANAVIVRERALPSTEGSGAAEDGEVILPADLVIVTAGAGVSPVVKAQTGLEKDKFGRLCVDGCLRAQGSQGTVYVLGDNAAVEGYDVLPASAQVAYQQSEVAAWNVWSSLNPRGPGPLQFRYLPLGEMLTLGSIEGAISSLQGLVKLEGPVANVLRRLVYISRMPTDRQKVRAAQSWIQTTAGKMRSILREGAQESAR